jgi:glyceraldehyde-3-phosphate dehydrogenase (NADP+)
VLSPICLRDAEDGLRQVELGSTPQGGETKAEAALEAAVRAYDNGRGI